MSDKAILLQENKKLREKVHILEVELEKSKKGNMNGELMLALVRANAEKESYKTVYHDLINLLV